MVFDDIVIDVVRKRIKHLYLRISPPLGAVRVSAPLRMPLSVIQAFARSKLPWIRTQRARIQSSARSVANDHSNGIALHDSDPPSRAQRAALDAAARQRLELLVPPLIAKWEPRMGVTVRRVSLRHMKTRWGSCSPASGRIRLNLELARKPVECLEYVVVHEMVHLLEPSHNHRFRALMDQFFPGWRTCRAALNSHESSHEGSHEGEVTWALASS